MASIKQRKSKGKARIGYYTAYGADSFEYLSPDYQLRKQQFADLPPAKIVRPLRAIRKVYEQALQAWHRSFVDGQPQLPFPHAEDTLYRTARHKAKHGNGQSLERIARFA